MNKMNILNILIFFFLIFLGFYLSLIGGYGSDEDTLPMIGVFRSFLNSGHFMTSRFTGYPVAEFGIGFLSYYLGSFYANLFTFLFFIIGSGLFFITIEKKINFNQIIFFLLILLSNPFLYFDNLEPMDYSWAFLFFALGTYFYSKKFTELACIFFGICIGTRINFVPFIILFLLFFHMHSNQIKKRFVIIFCSLFIGSLFYLPVWINSGLGFDWLRAGRPDDGLLLLFSRFFYKVIVSIGLIQLLIIIIYFLKNTELKMFNNLRFLNLIIFANLIIFLWIPAEISYLQPMLICVYYLCYKLFNKFFIYLLLFINLTTWLVNFDVVDIFYKNTDICSPKQAVSAKINIHFTEGFFLRYLESRKLIECWVDKDSDYGQKVILGLPLK
jgi:hypothetical protein